MNELDKMNRKINEHINSEVERMVKLWMQKAKGVDFADLLEKTVKRANRAEAQRDRLLQAYSILFGYDGTNWPGDDEVTKLLAIVEEVKADIATAAEGK